jgi:hypothetical protein
LEEALLLPPRRKRASLRCFCLERGAVAVFVIFVVDQIGSFSFIEYLGVGVEDSIESGSRMHAKIDHAVGDLRDTRRMLLSGYIFGNALNLFDLIL